MWRLPGRGVGDLAFAVIFSAAAWLVGRSMRRREAERQRAEADALAQQVAAEAALKSAVAEERTRIARELHDVVAHGMGAMVVQAAAAEQMLEVDPAAARQPLSTVRETGQGALAEMRRLLGLLRTGDTRDTDEPQPKLDQLPALVDRLRQGGMPVTLTITGEPSVLPVGLQLCAYRIVQEALTNSFKHAAGGHTTIRVTYESSSLDLRVHNSTGEPTAAGLKGLGHGLLGMQERVRLYGGKLSAGSDADGGFLVHAVIPVAP